MVKRTVTPPPRRVICIDLDGTLALTLDSLIRFHNSTYGTNLTQADFTSENYEEVWGGTREEAYLKIREFYASPYFAAIQPVHEGALETLKALKKRKFTLTIVTSRQQFIADQTKRFVDRHFPGIFDSIYFCNLGLTALERTQYISKPKSAICHEIGAEILIEDSLHHAAECAAMGVDVLLFDLAGTYKWNHASSLPTTVTLPANIRRVTSWKAVLAWFPRPTSPLRFSYTAYDDDGVDDDDDESMYISPDEDNSGDSSARASDDEMVMMGRNSRATVMSNGFVSCLSLASGDSVVGFKEETMVA